MVFCFQALRAKLASASKCLKTKTMASAITFYFALKLPPQGS